MSDAPPQMQLQMAWDHRRLGNPPHPVSIPDGYILRTYQAGDETGWCSVMDLAGFEGWDDEKLAPWFGKILPDGWFMIIHKATGDIVATAMALHGPTDFFPFGGELGWVAGNPAHSGKNLGTAVCAAVTARLIGAGYHLIHLNTDDFRLPAIKIYLKLGYVPFLFTSDMPDRWRAVCEKLNWPYAPEAWRHVDR